MTTGYPQNIQRTRLEQRKLRTRRPVSLVLCPAEAGDGHSSGPPIAGRFSRPTRIPMAPATAPPPPEGNGARTPIRSCSRRGLPCRPGRPVRGGLLPHPFTLTPNRNPRRFAFCGAIPRVTPGGRYPPPCRRGARTFLPRSKPRERPPGRLVRFERGSETRLGQVSA